MPIRSTLLVAAILALPACGSSGDTSTSAAPATFDVTNACAILPKEKVETATGRRLTGATLGEVVKATENTAGFSTCEYRFAGGGTLSFFARQSPFEDNTPEAIERTKQGILANMPVTLSNVDGLGTAAFRTEPMDQLHVFFGGNRYIIFSAPNAPKTSRPIMEIQEQLARGLIG